MSHVFEHLPNPGETLIEIRRILKPEGMIYLATPISDNFLFRLFEKRWRQLDTPRHLYIPSTYALKLLCKGIGLEIIKICYNRTDGLLGSIQYVHNERGGKLVYLTDRQGSRIYRNRFLMNLVRPIQFMMERLHLSDALYLEIIKK